MNDGSLDGRPPVLAVAGYDQSGGAGVLSDIKTLEAHSVYGYAVCTGFTFQNERRISRVQWFSEAEIFEQIDLCCETVRFRWVKIGITPSMRAARAIIGHIHQHQPDARVVLDPVIRASSGRDFWAGVVTGGSGDAAGAKRSKADSADAATEEAGAERRREDWEALAACCYLVTPNWEEIGWLYPGEDVQQRCAELSGRLGVNIYLKGGHHPEFPGRDYLWSGGEAAVLDPSEGATVYAKHGSGCVLASALTANLALGYALPEAAVRAKRYIEQFLGSNKTLLGWHRFQDSPV